jgi:hypothetical protein
LRHRFSKAPPLFYNGGALETERPDAPKNTSGQIRCKAFSRFYQNSASHATLDQKHHGGPQTPKSAAGSWQQT